MIMILENNEYAVGTSIKDACAAPDSTLQAASYGMDAHVVQGHDILALYRLISEVAPGIRKGDPPCLVEAKCYRRFHHAGDQPGSAFKYRSKKEEETYRQREVIRHFPELLVEGKVLTRKGVDHVEALASRAIELAVDHYTTPGETRKVIFDFFPDPDSASLGTRSDGSEFTGLRFSERGDFASVRQMKYSDAIATATGRWLEKEPEAFILGEEIANFGGGAYGATKGLPEKYPDRVLNTPLSENGFTGLALGAAMSGMKAIVEIMFPDFTLVAADQVFNQVAKARHMYGNTTDLPLVLRTRIAIGCGYGGQHSMDPVGLYALFSGWRIVAPANSFDYVGLFNTAMQSNDPVLMMEHNALYTEEFPLPEDNLDYFIEFGKARIIEEGKDITLIAYGYMAWRLEELASRFKENGVAAEIIDLRTVDLPSLDFDTIGRSLEKTGVAAVIEEAPTNLSIGAKIAAELTERYFDYLDSPVMRLSSDDVPPPVSRVLEESVRLDDNRILEMVSLAALRKWK
jgi:2-oxoisovalerate dehydrogenase E1 component